MTISIAEKQNGFEKSQKLLSRFNAGLILVLKGSGVKLNASDNTLNCSAKASFKDAQSVRTEITVTPELDISLTRLKTTLNVAWSDVCNGYQVDWGVRSEGSENVRSLLSVVNDRMNQEGLKFIPVRGTEKRTQVALGGAVVDSQPYKVARCVAEVNNANALEAREALGFDDLSHDF